MEDKIAGILGGMGPEATVDLMQRIIRLTPAEDDGDHVRLIVDNNPKVPSRIKALIEEDGTDPGPCLADMAKRLEKWGADFLAIPCNTAHFYYDRVQEAVDIPVINLIDLVTENVRRNYPQGSSIGLLASTAVIKTGLYEKRFKPLGLKLICPREDLQNDLLNIIKAIKAGNTGKEVMETYTAICSHLKGKGASLGIVACTELGILGGDLPFHIMDATEILAQEIVKRAKGDSLPHNSLEPKGV
ncbi:MAG: aspartate racemase RacD [Desulfobacterium sp. 4572_20]|nr:MAG: aspartate racemase RacD [Desulfobacterium sp. 4572_20]